MGNTIQAPKLFSDHEHRSGKRLLESIQANKGDRTQAAIDFARKEFSMPISSITSNVSDYEEMSTRMEKYLTKPYDVGDGIIFRKTPLEYCESVKSLESASVIKENLQKLRGVSGIPSKVEKLKEGNAESIFTGIENATVRLVTADRASLAKSRLQAFQATRK